MTPAASTEEIRTAYRALAQRLHPDRAASATAAERALAERRMREINESWEVLRDPARRRAYDEERLGAARRGPSSSRGSARTSSRGASGPPATPGDDEDEDLVDVSPEVHGLVGAAVRHLPWVVMLVVLAVIFVLSAYAGSGGSGEAPASTPAQAQPGDCLDLEPGPSTTIVPCDGPHELEVVTRVVDPLDCPVGTEGRRLGTDGRFECVREA